MCLRWEDFKRYGSFGGSMSGYDALASPSVRNLIKSAFSAAVSLSGKIPSSSCGLAKPPLS
jgi:hypothetical protein